MENGVTYPEWIYLKKKSYYLSLYPNMEWGEICRECENFYNFFVKGLIIGAGSGHYNKYLRGWIAREQYAKTLRDAIISDCEKGERKMEKGQPNP